MSVYLSDGDIAFGWKSFGRWFALIGLAAFLAAAVGFAITHGDLTRPTDFFAQFIAIAAFYVGGGLFILLTIAVIGSLMISYAERGGVEVTAEGVRRIFKPGREEFFPRQEIAGYVRVLRMGGGVALVSLNNRREMVIPRSLDGYRDCIAELKAMGLQSLPASRLRAKRRMTRAEKACLFAESVVFSTYLGTRGHDALPWASRRRPGGYCNDRVRCMAVPQGL